MRSESVGEFYPFVAALEDALRQGDAPDVAFAKAKAHAEQLTGKPCPFSVVRSCPSCKSYDRGHCHRWGKDVPGEYVEQGCSEHVFVQPTSAADVAGLPF